MVEKIRKLISVRKIKRMVDNIALEIIKSHGDSDLTFITVLDGALPFSRDLTKKVFRRGVGLSNSCIKVKSYRGTKYRGNLELEQGLVEDISGKKVLLVEDIVDGGRTIDFLRGYLLNEKTARSVEVVSLLSNPSRRVIDVKIDYLGMEVPDKFVVGYGMDFNGMYRDLDYVGVLED